MAQQVDEEAPPPPSAPVASASLDDDPEDERRVALRQKGAEFFERAMAAAARGADPFAPAAQPDGGQAPSSAAASTGLQPQQSGSKARRTWSRRRRDGQDEDPDLVAFGEAFERTKRWLYMGVHVACTAASPVLIKASLYSLQAPAVLLFLHMLAAILAIWIASTYDVFQLHQLTPAGLKGCAVAGSLWALKMLCVFSVLLHNSVIFVLAWTLVFHEAIRVLFDALARRQPIGQDTRTLLIASGVPLVIEILFDTDLVWVGFLMMVLWTLLSVAEAGWKLLKMDPTIGGRIMDFRVTGLLRELSEEEDALTLPNMVFLQHAVPAVPILVLGFIALEGREIVHHELSVPAVTTMLLACAAHTGAVGSDLLLEGRLLPRTRLLMRVVATLGSIAAYFVEEIRTISYGAVLCSLVACVAAHVLAWRRPSTT